MDVLPLTNVTQAVDTLLTSPGSCSPALRQAVLSHAAELSRGHHEATEIPNALVPYVNKVALHAYQVTDGDVEQLKDAGYSEDAIFEITLCASVGASLARLEQGLSVIEGNK